MSSMLVNMVLCALFAALTVAIAVGLDYFDCFSDTERKQKEKQAEYTLTIVDADGIPVRQHRMSGKGVARIISDLNAFPSIYK